MSRSIRSKRLRNWALGLGVALGGSLPAPSLACGGLFCSAANPVNQAAERIIFAADGETVTAVIEIQYQGPAELFSWVLPVPGVPDIQVSSKLALDRLQGATNPQYLLQTQFGDGCFGPRTPGGPASGASGAAGSGGDDVTVLESGTVGPYDYDVIEVNPTLPDRVGVAVDWLDENGYDVTGLGEDRLRPYLDDDLNLLAFRLTKDATAGSIRPVILQYESRNAMIPIRPTAVAANENMGVMVWVLGRARAIPVNYRALILNESLIDWFNPNRNYNDVVIAAADEASGQGFVTEYSNVTSALPDVVLRDFESQAFDALNAQLPLRSLLVQLIDGFASFDGLREALVANVRFRASVDVDAFVSCVDCYFDGLPVTGTVDDDPIFGTDVAALLADVREDVVDPMRATQALFDGSDWMTRFYTTLSPAEMNADPVFDFNADLEPVSNLHTATRVVECDSSGNQAGWETTLPDGTFVRGEGTAWPDALFAGPPNRQVLQYGTSGPGRVLIDNVDEIQDLVDQSNGAIGGAGPDGGGSAGAPGGGSGAGGRSNGAGGGAGDAAAGGPYTPGGSGCSCGMAADTSGLGAFAGLVLAVAALRRRARQPSTRRPLR